MEVTGNSGGQSFTSFSRSLALLSLSLSQLSPPFFQLSAVQGNTVQFHAPVTLSPHKVSYWHTLCQVGYGDKKKVFKSLSCSSSGLGFGDTYSICEIFQYGKHKSEIVLIKWNDCTTLLGHI